MGFLFDMLEKAAGQNCQATNFLKIFSALPKLADIGLDEESRSQKTLDVKIQDATKVILDKIAFDFRQAWKGGPAAMDSTLATVGLLHYRCASCGSDSYHPENTIVHDLIYPPRPANRHVRNSGPLFSQVLKLTVERHAQTRGWCDRCGRYVNLTSQKRVQSVPPVLMINAAIGTLQLTQQTEAKQHWARPGWLPQEIGIIVDQGNFFCFEGQDLKHHLQRGAYKIEVYELIGTVNNIHYDGRRRSHLVSNINGKISMLFSTRRPAKSA